MKMICELRVMTPEDKERHWGKGEWCEEFDFVEFEHAGLYCIVNRQIYPEGESFSGGFFCGYVCMPEEHPWIYIESGKIPTFVHGGISYSDRDEMSGKFMMGFSCCHDFDLVPSRPNRGWLGMNGDGVLFNNDVYRNLAFCLKECMKLAEEISEASNEQGQ